MYAHCPRGAQGEWLSRAPAVPMPTVELGDAHSCAAAFASNRPGSSAMTLVGPLFSVIVSGGQGVLILVILGGVSTAPMPTVRLDIAARSPEIGARVQMIRKEPPESCDGRLGVSC